MSALPGWDLSDLYASINDPAIEQDLARTRSLCEQFQSRYEDKVESCSGEQLAAAIAEYEIIQEMFGKLGSYAQLVYAADMHDPAIGQFHQNIQERVNELSLHVLFFALALNRIEEGEMQRKLAAPALRKYQPWIRDTRAFRPHQLSDDLEKLLHEKYVTGRAAWVRLFDETMAALCFRLGGKTMTSAEAFNLLSSKDGMVRKQAAKAIGKVLGKELRVFSLITNTLAKDKEIEDNWRGFEQPISSRNLSNYVEDEVVEALTDAVRKNYRNLSHRYYALKAKWFGQDRLPYWDRNAPLPEDDDHPHSWEEARELVLSSYAAFSPTLAEIGRQFFDKNWIDVPVRPGKSPGAFAHPTVPSAHPYLLLNFQGKTRDVMTLAHELGHGVHQVLSARQGTLMSDTPLTLAETASVFGEQLTFQEILRREKDTNRRKILIAGKVEDMLNTVVRQVAFCEFERRVHDERRNGEVTAEKLGDIWLAQQKESLGPAIKFSKEYRAYWSYIPHFVHTPFYVYAYAFGDCLVNSLYAVYQQQCAEGKGAEFEKKYIAMLEAGGTLRHKELLAPFGLDATDPDFWQQGLNIISGFIDQLERL